MLRGQFAHLPGLLLVVVGAALDQAALDDRLVKEAVRGRRLQKGVHLSAAARLAEDRDVVRISAEAGDVVVDPFQGRDHVGGAEVAGVLILLSEGGEVEIADAVETVVDGDDDHVAEFRQLHAVVRVEFDRGARRVSAAVEPDHDRLLRAVINVLCPQVQVEAVLVLRVMEVRHVVLVVRDRRVDLLAHRPEDVASSRAFPRRHFFRHLKALCLRVRNAAEDEGPFLQKSPHLARLCLNHGVIRVRDDGSCQLFRIHNRIPPLSGLSGSPMSFAAACFAPGSSPLFQIWSENEYFAGAVCFSSP